MRPGIRIGSEDVQGRFQVEASTKQPTSTFKGPTARSKPCLR